MSQKNKKCLLETGKNNLFLIVSERCKASDIREFFCLEMADCLAQAEDETPEPEVLEPSFFFWRSHIGKLTYPKKHISQTKKQKDAVCRFFSCLSTCEVSWFMKRTP